MMDDILAELDRKFEQAVSELLDATILKESLADLQAELDALWSSPDET